MSPSTFVRVLSCLIAVQLVYAKLDRGVIFLNAAEEPSASAGLIGAVGAGAAAGSPAKSSVDDAGTPWQFVGKFGYAIGSGLYDVRVRLVEPPAGYANLDFEVFLDEDWDRVAALGPCRKAMLARKTQPLRASQQWSPWTGGVLEQNVRPHIWYFALSRCGGLGAYNHYNATSEPLMVEYELHTVQHDNSELSMELRYMPLAVATALVIISCFLARFRARCQQFSRFAGAVHPVIQLLATAVILQWLAQALHLAHLGFFEMRGTSESLVESVADVLFMLSQVVSSSVLLVIAQGYTLDRSRDSLLDKVKPIAAAIALLHVILVGHGKLQGEHADKHHEHGGLAGCGLILARLLLFVWFISGVRSLRRSSSFRLQPFLGRFMLAGSLYFLAFPVIFVVVQLFAQYLQHPFLEIGMVAMQTMSAFWLSDLFLSKGVYYQVSTLSESLLPGGFSPSSSPGGTKFD